jgi:hypothetical protein
MAPELFFHLAVIIGAIVTIPIARLRYGTWLTTGLLYSFGWCMCLILYHYVALVSPDGGFDISDSSFEFASKIVIGGYLGVILGHLFFGPPRVHYGKVYHEFSHLGLFLDRYYLWICGLIFSFGFLAFVERFSQVGFSIYVLQELRELHTETRFSFFQRFGVLGSIILSTFVMLSAVDDSMKGRVNTRRIIAITIALMPLALSKASRQEFMNPIIQYSLAAFVVMQMRVLAGMSINRSLLFKMYAKFLPALLALFLLFTVYGQLRTVGSKQQGGRFDMFSLLKAPIEVTASVASWFTSSLYSVGPITEFEDKTFPRLYGRMVFEPVYKIPEKLRLIPETSVLIYLARQDSFNHFNNGSIAFTPGTMGKVLTREVGRNWAPVAAVFVMLLMTALANRVPRDSILKLVFVVSCISQPLLSFQSLQGFNMIFTWRMFFAFLLGYMYLRFRRRFGVSSVGPVGP